MRHRRRPEPLLIGNLFASRAPLLHNHFRGRHWNRGYQDCQSGNGATRSEYSSQMDGNEFLQHEQFLEEPASNVSENAGNSKNLQLGDGNDVQQGDYVVIDGVQYRIDGENGEVFYMVAENEETQPEDDILEDGIVIHEEDAGNRNEFLDRSAAFQSREQKQAIKMEMKANMEIPPEQDIVTSDDEVPTGIYVTSLPQGLKSRKNRQYGSCACPECGQTFINQARLERHLAVHQLFGSFLCPLCQKTFKYEYNLFFHWRRTCRDLMDVIPTDERTTMDVHSLRMLVEDIAQKRPQVGPVDIGISKSILFQYGPQSRLEIPASVLGRRGTACSSCGVLVSTAHAPRHAALHRNDCNLQPDDESPSGGYFCDLCGIVYRQHTNLIKHWRTSCPEIQANLPSNDLVMDDEGLRGMVMDLLRRAQTKSKNTPSFLEREVSPMPGPSRSRVDENHIVVDDDVDDRGLTPTPPVRAHPERDLGIVFADDFGTGEMMVVGEDGGMKLAKSEGKWKLPDCANSVGVQCPECMRMFANIGRLERHLMGFHANFGSHHCILCGNRFKYDYNLLFHYRKSCPYTKTFIEKDVREQIAAPDLRKLVRGLAQKKMSLKPVNLPKLPGILSPYQMRKLRVPPRDKPVPRPTPPQLLKVRPELSDRQPERCPLCEVVFYGQNNLDRHISNAHHADPAKLRKIQEADDETAKMAAEKTGIPIEDYAYEEPPRLERQEPVFENVEQISNMIRFIDQNGDEIREFDPSCMDAIRSHIENGSANDNVVFLVVAANECIYNVEIVETFEEGPVKVVMLSFKMDERYLKDSEELELIMSDDTNEKTEGDVCEEVVYDDGTMLIEEIVDTGMPIGDIA